MQRESVKTAAPEIGTVKIPGCKQIPREKMRKKTFSVLRLTRELEEVRLNDVDENKREGANGENFMGTWEPL